MKPSPRLSPSILIAAITVAAVGCGNFTIIANEDNPKTRDMPGGTSSGVGASGSSSGQGGASNGGSGGGSGGDIPIDQQEDLLPIDGSYSYLCGAPTDMCVPGPDDSCALGGDPQMGTPDASVVGCQLVPSGNDVHAVCAATGTFGVEQPCTTSADCQPGLGCVETAALGKCRPYCCGDLEACAADSYCAPARMNGESISIPTCTPVIPCELLNDTTCPTGLTCAIVRASGLTSCVKPGDGYDDQPCPCAAGYYCRPATSTCVKLCHTAPGSDDCGPTAVCQGGVNGMYPDGFGTCVPY